MGPSSEGNCGPLCEPAPWSQSQGTRGDGRVNNCIFHGHVSVWVCAAERWQIVPSMATMRALFACQKNRCEFDKEQVIRGCVHLFRTMKRGREQDTLDLHVLCQFILTFTSLR